MKIVLSTPGVQELDHVGATAAAVRTWSHAGKILAVGLLDGPRLLRMAVDPCLRDDDALARQIVADTDDHQHGVLDAGRATIEARGAVRLTQLLSHIGWQQDELWTPFHHDLTGPVDNVSARVEVIGPDRADLWLPVHWSAFHGASLTEEDRNFFVGRLRTMAAGPFYASARNLAAFDEHNNAVAVTTVWSAGPGRPGLLEPMGVHRNHRGHGYGTVITLAGAASLARDGVLQRRRVHRKLQHRCSGHLRCG